VYHETIDPYWQQTILLMQPVQINVSFFLIVHYSVSTSFKIFPKNDK
jgi:hypothetical protein